MKLYVSNNCPACKLVESSELLRQFVSWVEIRNIDTNPHARYEFDQHSLRTVPALVDQRNVIVGAMQIFHYLRRLVIPGRPTM